MSDLAVIKALQERLSAMPDNLAYTAWENESAPVVEDQDPYQAVIMIPAPPENPTLGDTYYRENGIMRIRLFYPTKKGTGAARLQAERIRDWFYRGLSLPKDGIVTIIRRTPGISPGTVTTDRYVVVVDVNYFASVFPD